MENKSNNSHGNRCIMGLADGWGEKLIVTEGSVTSERAASEEHRTGGCDPHGPASCSLGGVPLAVFQ